MKEGKERTKEKDLPSDLIEKEQRQEERKEGGNNPLKGTLCVLGRLNCCSFCVSSCIYLGLDSVNDNSCFSFIHL